MAATFQPTNLLAGSMENAPKQSVVPTVAAAPTLPLVKGALLGATSVPKAAPSPVAAPRPSIVPQAQAAEVPQPSASPIESGPQVQNFKLSANTIQGWLDSGRTTLAEAHSTAMAMDPNYRLGVQRLSDYNKAHGMVSDINDPDFIQNAMRGYYKIGSEPLQAGSDTDLLLRTLEKQTAIPPPVQAPEQVQEKSSPWYKPITDYFGAVGNEAKAGIVGGGEGVRSNLDAMNNGEQDKYATVMGSTGSMGFGIGRTLAAPVTPLVQGLLGHLGDYFNQIKDPVSKGAIDSIKQSVASGAPIAADAWKHLQETHPDVAKTLEAAAGIGSAALAAQGVQGVAQTGENIVENAPTAVKGLVNDAKNIVNPSPYSDQTRYLAEYYGTTPEKLIQTIQEKGTDINKTSLADLQDHLGQTFNKDPSGYDSFIQKRLGTNSENLSEANAYPTEQARIDAESATKNAENVTANTTKAEGLQPEDQKAWQAIQPKNTAKNMKEAVANGTYSKGAKEAGLFKSSSGPAPDKMDMALIKRVKEDVPELLQAKSLPDKLDAVGKVLQKTGEERDALLEANNVVYPNAESNSVIREAALKSGKLYGNDGKDIANGMADDWAEIRAQNSGDIKGELNSLKQFEKVMSKGSDAIYSKDTVQGNIFRSIRRASQDVISKQLESTDLPKDVYQPLIDKMADMYDIRDNLATHVNANDFLSTAGKALKNKYVKLGLGFAGYETLKHDTPLGAVMP